MQPELFAATSLVECLRLWMSCAAENKKDKVLYVDVSRAYSYARSIPTYIKWPAEDARNEEDGICGCLLYSMYGTCDAAHTWSEEYGSKLVAFAFFAEALQTPRLFYNSKTTVNLKVRGDDVLAVGPSEIVAALKTTLENAYEGRAGSVGQRAKQEGCHLHAQSHPQTR